MFKSSSPIASSNVQYPSKTSHVALSILFHKYEMPSPPQQTDFVTQQARRSVKRCRKIFPGVEPESRNNWIFEQKSQLWVKKWQCILRLYTEIALIFIPKIWHFCLLQRQKGLPPSSRTMNFRSVRQTLNFRSVRQTPNQLRRPNVYQTKILA